MTITDTHVYFYSGNDIYSNFYKAHFKDPLADLTFRHTEGAFMYYKAWFFRDLATAAKAAKEIEPSNVKILGRQVQGFNNQAWECVRLGYMTYVNLLKYQQNPELAKELLSTGNRILVEASPHDKVWGVGLAENDDCIFDSRNWQGRNLLGESLMTVRKLLDTKP